MSHLMAYAFERFVFFHASAADRERVSALQILHTRLTPARTFFIHNNTEFGELMPNDLLICCGDSFSAAHRALSEAGVITALSLADFQLHAGRLLALQSSSAFGEVVLAFLPDLLKKQAMRIFSLFGFNPVAVDSSQGLLRELKHGASIVVFDQDMPALRGRVSESREKIFSLLRAERRAHRHLSVLIIKDFDQGSLFGDMTTMAKDVSNAMLSPNEFLEFIRNYLSDFHAAHATWKLRMGNATGLAHSTYSGRPSPCLGLADVKSAFQLSQDKAYHEFAHAREQMLVETQDLFVRMAVTEWMFDRRLAQEADNYQKNIIIKTELPRIFDKPLPASAPATVADEPAVTDTMFN